MKNKAAVELGKLGGEATKEKLGVEHFKKIAKGWPKGKKRKKLPQSSLDVREPGKEL